MSYYQAQVAKNNQQMAEQSAQYALAAGQQNAATTSLRGAAKVGAIKTQQGASGVDVNTGTAVDVQAGERQSAQLDTETVLNNAQRQAYGYRVQGVNYGAQAGLDIAQAGYAGQQASDATTAGFLKAGGSLLSGAQSYLGGWNKGNGQNGGYTLAGAPSGGYTQDALNASGLAGATVGSS